MRRWFLSYHSPDESLAERLKAAIERKDDSAIVFFAPVNLRTGARWAPALAEAIAGASAFVLLATERGIGRWQEIEYDAEFDSHVNSTDFPIVLMSLEGQAAPHFPGAAPLDGHARSDTRQSCGEADRGCGCRSRCQTGRALALQHALSRTSSPPDAPVGQADQTPLVISEATPCRSI